MIIKIHRTLHVEKPEDYAHITHKLKLIKEFSKVQDTESTYKNQLHFYVLKTDYPRRKLRKQSQ